MGAFVLFLIVLSVAGKKKRFMWPSLFLKGPGAFSIDIVGESHYQEALNDFCGGKNIDGYHLPAKAWLLCENDNPNDDKAVRVDIDGLTVGYLSRELAREYRQRLQEAGHPESDAYCNALIVGGWRRSGYDQGDYGVRLDLPRAADMTCSKCGEFIGRGDRFCRKCGNPIPKRTQNQP